MPASMYIETGAVWFDKARLAKSNAVAIMSVVGVLCINDKSKE